MFRLSRASWMNGVDAWRRRCLIKRMEREGEICEWEKLENDCIAADTAIHNKLRMKVSVAD